MSGRFGRLEFDDERHARREEEERVAPIEGTAIRTAEHYAAQAETAHRLGRLESALQHYTRWVREDRAAIPAWVGQVQMLVQLGECAEARLWADKALELFRENGELLAAKAQACLRQGDGRAALAGSDASLRSPGSSPWRWEVRGEILLTRRRGLYRDCFQKALAEATADWFDRVVISTILLFHGRAAAALDYAQQAVALRPAHPYNWLVLGRCQAALGWLDSAASSFGHALELDPQFVEATRAVEDLRSQGLGQRLRRRLRGWLRR